MFWKKAENLDFDREKTPEKVGENLGNLSEKIGSIKKSGLPLTPAADQIFDQHENDLRTSLGRPTRPVRKV